MELYERINQLITEQGLTKREFAQRLIALEPRSKRTGETMSEKAVYAYLSGKSVIDADLVPYIAEALHISEQFLFREDPKSRARQIRYLFGTLDKSEKQTIRELSIKLHPNHHQQIIALLPYASEPILQKFEKILLEMKAINEKM